jgi:uncharacterized peroxidase-related enzyme
MGSQAAADHAHDSAGLSDGAGFLGPPPSSARGQQMFDEDAAQLGYVMNLSRLWAHRPALHDALGDLMQAASDAAGLSLRQRGILVTACASTVGDSYCSLAWGQKLADEVGDPELAAGVLRGDDTRLEPSEQALARWARLVARDPNAVRAADVQAVRDAGFDDEEILAITTYLAVRIAFSTVNDALGVRPDRGLGETVPAPVREAVTYGRPVADS